VKPNGEHGHIDNWRDRFAGRPEQWMNGRHRGGHHCLTSTTPPELRDVMLDMARSIATYVADGE
jgi:hypothetical protein